MLGEDEDLGQKKKKKGIFGRFIDIFKKKKPESPVRQ